MRLDEFDQFCGSLPHTTFVVQWGESHVWKIGGKVFAIGGWNDKETLGVTFKCSPDFFRIFKNAPGLRPAPYLASRGMSWLQWLGPESMSVDKLEESIVQSYKLVGRGLPKYKQREFGIE